MTRLPPSSALSLIPPMDAVARHMPAHTHLDFLGRMPIPLRRAFKSGLDQTTATHRQASGESLHCCFLSGAEWYRPFDTLSSDPVDTLPGMLVSTFYHDILNPALLAHYTPAASVAPRPSHPACAAAGLDDPLGIFRTFAVIPFVFLVDEKRLRGRPAPHAWSDLLDPIWADDIVFGGWRPNEQSAYQDYNSYLLLCLHHEFGDAGLAAFAGNVRHLQHNIRTATQAGSNSREVGAIAILPWLQAELCPRRERTRVVWPEDGALAMPIGYLVKTGEESRVQPLIDYVDGSELGAVLSRNCYPPTRPQMADAFPAGARLKWPGWDTVRQNDMAATSQRAAETFFAAWYGKHTQEQRACS